MTATLKLTMKFADKTSRSLELGPFDATKILPQNIRAAVRTVNADIADIANIYVSDGGAACTGISAASIIVTSENEIELN